MGRLSLRTLLAAVACGWVAQFARIWDVSAIQVRPAYGVCVGTSGGSITFLVAFLSALS